VGYKITDVAGKMRYTAKLSPHPQLRLALGLLK
jgi:hypothetical protein